MSGIPMSGVAQTCAPCPEPAKKLRTPYHLEVILDAPDQARVVLWKGDKFVEMVAEIDPADLDDDALDSMGRLKPELIWDTLEECREMLLETREIEVHLPKKTDIFGARY
jgi:hypothetical protein